MSSIDFSIIPEDDSGFLDIPVGAPRSLSDLFASSVAETSPNSDLSGHDILATSDETAEQTDFVEKKEYFKKIKHGNQAQNAGEIRVQLAQKYCEKLNEYSEETHVVFSPSRLQNPISGGTCSAMAFDFADKYLDKRPTMTPDEIFDEIAPRFENSSLLFRTRQAVFNTLRKDDRYPPADFMRDKVGSMLRAYGRSITDSSEMFYMKDTLTLNSSSKEIKQAMKKIEQFLNEHSEGVFVIRCVVLEDNDKGELFGHSTTLIREKDKSYFYDPNEGIYELPKETEALVDILKPMMQKWCVPFGRIYRIQ